MPNAHCLMDTPLPLDRPFLDYLKSRRCYIHQSDVDLFSVDLATYNEVIVLDAGTLHSAVWQAHQLLVMLENDPATLARARLT